MARIEVNIERSSRYLCFNRVDPCKKHYGDFAEPMLNTKLNSKFSETLKLHTKLFHPSHWLLLLIPHMKPPTWKFSKKMQIPKLLKCNNLN